MASNGKLFGQSTNWPLLLAAVGAGSWLAIQLLRGAREYNLRGKVVLVTGGSRGLGLVLARQLAEEGAYVAICARDQEELDRAYDDLTDRTSHVLAIPCDLADEAQVRAMVEVILNRWGAINVLFNNAGTIGVGPAETMTLEDFHHEMDNNYWSTVHATLAALPEMRRRREGRIVNISSIGGKISVPHLLSYIASKFAVVGFSEGLRAELAKDGIVVTTVCPGLMRTGSPRHAEFKGKHRAEYLWFNLGSSAPFFSMSAERAAKQIIKACKQGTAEVVLSLPAKVAVKFHDLFPGLTCDLLNWVNRLLPGPGGIGEQRAKGKDSESVLAPSVLTILSDRAAERNNEITPEEAPKAEGQQVATV